MKGYDSFLDTQREEAENPKRRCQLCDHLFYLDDMVEGEICEECYDAELEGKRQYEEEEKRNENVE